MIIIRTKEARCPAPFPRLALPIAVGTPLPISLSRRGRRSLALSCSQFRRFQLSAASRSCQGAISFVEVTPHVCASGRSHGHSHPTSPAVSCSSPFFLLRRLCESRSPSYRVRTTWRLPKIVSICHLFLNFILFFDLCQTRCSSFFHIDETAPSLTSFDECVLCKFSVISASFTFIFGLSGPDQ